jgi:hypothetical protein
MPNWCSNDIEIQGDAEKIAEFINDIQASERGLSMDRYIPMPQLDTETSTEWYNWRLANWGTKWDINPDELHSIYDEDIIQYSYPTAWAPNTPFWEFMSNKFPELSIVHHYEELGMSFKGVATYKAGEVRDQQIEW